MRARANGIALLTVALLGCTDPPTPAPAPPAPFDPGIRLTEVSALAGIDFRYTFGDFAYDNIVESSGSGATWLDADGDGDLDLYLLQGAWLPEASDPKGRVHQGATNALYRNDGGGRFTDATAASGLGDARWSMAASPADYDDDGDTDLLVSNYGPNRLYRNRGDGTFEDVAGATGLAGPETLHGFTKWSVGAAWLDADRDGDLDVVVCNFLAFDPQYLHPGRPWEMPEPKEYRGQASLLYLQREDGTFEEGTEGAGLYRPDSKCMGVTVMDFDGDGLLDVFQGNDHQPNSLFLARGDGTYEDVAMKAGVALNDDGAPTGSMHGTPGDVDGDGRIDLLVVDLRHGSLYRRAEGEGLLYEDRTARSGLKAMLKGLGQWGTGLQDLDLDGDLDLFVTNGVAHILVPQPPLLAAGDGVGGFRAVGAVAGPYLAGTRSGRGAAFADYDDDGDVDVIVNHVDHEARAALLRNDSPRRGHFVGFRLVGARPRTAYGAEVRVEAGGRTFVRVHQPWSSYLSSNDPRVHVGLGPATRVDRVTVRWPSGRTQVWEGLEADRYVTLQETAEPGAPR